MAVLLQTLSATDRTITVDEGPLSVGMTLCLENEHCLVDAAMTPTQALIIRGMEGSASSPHAIGTWVDLHDPIGVRPERADLNLADTMPQARCPHCGR